MDLMDIISKDDWNLFQKTLSDLTKDGEDKGSAHVYEGNGFDKLANDKIGEISIGDKVTIKKDYLMLVDRIIQKFFNTKEQIFVLCFLEGFYEIYEGVTQVLIYFKDRKNKQKFFLIGIDYLEK